MLGRVVPFQVSPEVAAAKTEAILERIAEHYRACMKAKEELPGVLVELAEAGETDLVLRAIVLWGSGEMEAHEVLRLCRERRVGQPLPDS